MNFLQNLSVSNIVVLDQGRRVFLVGFIQMISSLMAFINSTNANFQEAVQNESFDSSTLSALAIKVALIDLKLIILTISIFRLSLTAVIYPFWRCYIASKLKNPGVTPENVCCKEVIKSTCFFLL